VNRLDAVAALHGAAPEANGGTVLPGERIREHRLRRRMTLREVARETGLSESFLSQLERGLTNASIPSLQRITTALGVSIGELFDPSETGATRVMRRGDRPALTLGEGFVKYLLTPKWMQDMEVLAVTFQPGCSTGAEPYVHGDSEELLIVVSGSVEARIGEQHVLLGAGDSVSYRSSVPHSAWNAGPAEAEVIYVVSPPSY
jgi:transcriptional regulator with XRE-family HTH domain